ncbi:MAG: DNA mismatch repair protein MutS [Phycisphaerales bacterium]|nr:DNA mismatch repair protein MutS [Phycisphaerales bacterium]
MPQSRAAAELNREVASLQMLRYSRGVSRTATRIVTDSSAAAPPDPPVGDRRTPTAAPAESELTPAMRQWWVQKQQVGDALLLFRMGDFYELFYDDAVEASRLLGITLTSRDSNRTPLAGIPHHALDSYLGRLVAGGRKVAISEQIEDPKQAKGVIQRAVVRIVTPGTLTDDTLLDRARPNVLAAVRFGESRVGMAALELSTGELSVQMIDATRLLDELARVAPAEVLLSDAAMLKHHTLGEQIRTLVGAAPTGRAADDFSEQRTQSLLFEQFEITSLEGFGFDAMDDSLCAAGALLLYVRETQRGAAQHIRPPRRRSLDRVMTLDATTLRSLEIERTLRSGSREGSLLAAVDATRSAMGARLLRQWLCYPLRDRDDIERRQRLVGALRDNPDLAEALRVILGKLPDIGRTVGRIGVQRTTPRELRALGDGLLLFAEIRAILDILPHGDAQTTMAALDGLDSLAEELTRILRADAPLGIREGGLIADGIDAELDRLRAIHFDGRQWLADYQVSEAQRTGIPSLKVAYNRVFGFYIEITNTHRDRVPADYLRRQTVKNAERYTTEALRRYEGEVLTAESRANEMEYQLFLQLRDRAAEHLAALAAAANALAEIDILAGWAELALRRGYCRPEFVAAPLLEIGGGRHPAVESSLGSAFVPNDTRLLARGGEDGESPNASSTLPRGTLALITGPNMAGKSTYIRQVASLALLAHCGCWVPAESMRLGLIDRIFTRVGAADELARGQSTFMVEMLETANIVHNATSDSLVILDEIGRGTSTFDGLSLAWAISEHLALRVGCRALFATHYHELTELAELVEGVVNLNVAVREFEDSIVFLHRIVAGAADRSYGLHVAKLAGVPRAVLERASAVLLELERTFSRESQRPVLAAAQRRRHRQLRLFEEPEEAIVRDLRGVDVSRLDATTAIELLRRWRDALGPGA